MQAPDAAVADGTGGIYIVWTDPPTSTVKGQHVLYDGSLAPGWPAGGKVLSSPHTNAMDHANPEFLTVDDTGNLEAAWMQQDASLAWHPYAFRFDAAGSAYPGWPPSGVLLSPGAVILSGMPVASDGAGGLFVAWDDSRVPSSNSYYDDIYAQHVLADGTLAPGFPVDGLVVCGAPNLQQNVHVMGDGSGGAIVAWDDYRDQLTVNQYDQDVYAVRIRANGTLAPGWAVNGNPVAAEPGFQNLGYLQRLATDGQGGAFIAYDYSTKCFRQHLLGDGSVDPTYGPYGTVVGSGVHGQYDVVLLADGHGGVFEGWGNGGFQDAGIWASHIGPDIATATAVSLMSSDVQPDEVWLTWQALRSLRATVERREGGGPWQSLGDVATDGQDRLVYDDRSVTPGTSYSYRLTYVDGSTTEHSAETTILVPRAYTLALSGFRPNPASSADLAISFELPSTAPGRLELLDVTGRRVTQRDLSGYAAGRYTEHLSQGARVPPGMYWVRLSHGSKALTARGIVLR